MAEVTKLPLAQATDAYNEKIGREIDRMIALGKSFDEWRPKDDGLEAVRDPNQTLIMILMREVGILIDLVEFLEQRLEMMEGVYPV